MGSLHEVPTSTSDRAFPDLDDWVQAAVRTIKQRRRTATAGLGFSVATCRCLKVKLCERSCSLFCGLLEALMTRLGLFEQYIVLELQCSMRNPVANT